MFFILLDGLEQRLFHYLVQGGSGERGKAKSGMSGGSLGLVWFCLVFGWLFVSLLLWFVSGFCFIFFLWEKFGLHNFFVSLL
jgi:hypothetical protein